MNYTYITDFYKSRENRIGSSDIPALIPHPVRKSESLAGYERTAITVYEEKTEITKREPAGFSARVGNDIEGLPLRYFIEEHENKDVARDFYKGYILCKIEKETKSDGLIDCSAFNNTDYKHNTESMNDFGVAHADCLYVGKKPFIIEAKSAQFWSVKRKEDLYVGYDFDLKDWQGIPLKHYFQIQFQMALYGVDTAYLALLYNTSEFHTWKIDGNKKHQADLLELAEYMKKCIDTKTPPKEKAMNASDIQKLYPIVLEDFRESVGKELEDAQRIAKEYTHAKQQIKQWELKERDCLDAMSVLLKDTREIKGLIGDELQTIAKWKDTGGAEKIVALSKIKKEWPEVYESLKDVHLIEYQKTDRKPEIKLRMG
jgi:hypothetical protein